MSSTDPTSPDYDGQRPVPPPPPPAATPPYPTDQPYPTPTDSGPVYPSPGQPIPPPAAPPPYADSASYSFPAAPQGVAAGIPSMGTRLVARIIDAVIFAVAYVVLGAIGLAGVGLTGDSDTANAFAATGMMASVVSIGIIGLLYEVVLIALRGATIGKQVMGIKVVKVADGSIPGWGPSIIRWVIPYIGSWFCGVGQLIIYLSPFWADSSGRQRGYHDMAAGTVVVNAR